MCIRDRRTNIRCICAGGRAASLGNHLCTFSEQSVLESAFAIAQSVAQGGWQQAPRLPEAGCLLISLRRLGMLQLPPFLYILGRSVVPGLVYARA
eukprot:899042-Pyramimonas_sp.AAC.1